MKKKLLFIIISVVLLITVVFNVYAGEAADKLLIEYKDDLLTLMIKDTLLKEVLDEIGHKTGVKVTSHDLSEQKITVEFHALPLDEGIRKVIGPHNNSIFFYEEKKGEDGSPLLSKLAEMEGPEVLGALLLALEDEDGDVRASAAEALGTRKSKEAFEPLIKALS